MPYLASVSSFVAGLIVSGLIIYVVTSIFSKKRGLMTAVFTALVGSIIYTLAGTFSGFFATLLGGLAWLLALKHFYNMGWFRCFIVALVIWIVAGVVDSILPTVIGPL